MAEIVERPRSATLRETARRILGHENAILALVLFAIIGAMGVVTEGATISRLNASNVLLQSSTRGVNSVGQAFVILSGGIDLSIGGMAIMTAMIGGVMMTSIPEYNLIGYPVPAYIAMAVMLLAGLGFGAISGLAVSRIGLPPLIVTLGMWQITNGIGYLLTMGHAITDLPRSFNFFGGGEIARVPVPIIIFISVSVVAYLVLYNTRFGRAVYATGGSPMSAWLSGINVKRVLFSVYAISGFLAALSGLIATARVECASLRTMVNFELDSIAAVSIGGVSLAGGRGTLIGVVIGVIIIGVVNNGLSMLGAGPAIVDISKGAIIFTAVAIDLWRRRR
jgi:ribose/xylose/arabinose/galactoside ABC-type transport system permease subunit